MQLVLATLLLSPSILSFATAAGTCTSSGSLSWPPVGDCSKPLKFDTLVQNCRACCLNDQPCFTACLKAGGISKRDTTGEKVFGGIVEKRDLSNRAIALSCDVNEGCYKYTDGSLLCLNLGTGNYHDDVGGNGNYFSGVYTGPDGKVQTGTSAPTATSGSKSSAVASQTTRSTASAQATTAGAASAAKSSAAASATSLASGNILNVGANLGFVGFLAGLVL